MEIDFIATDPVWEPRFYTSEEFKFRRAGFYVKMDDGRYYGPFLTRQETQKAADWLEYLVK
jgi:hypothetical protein